MVAAFFAIPAIKKHGALIINILCMRPSTRFNHHLRIFSYSDSLSVAPRLRATAIRAAAAIIGVNPALLGDFKDPSATLHQLLSPATCGGLLIPDPIFLARPCSLADLSDCLPSLLADDVIGPLIADYASWRNSACSILADATEFFSTLTASHPFTTAVPHNPDSTKPPTIPQALLHPRTGQPCISRLYLLSTRHAQSYFVNVLYTRLWNSMMALPVDYAAPKLPQPSTTPLTHLPTELELPTALSEYAHARVKACTMRGASALITAWSIPATMHSQTSNYNGSYHTASA